MSRIISHNFIQIPLHLKEGELSQNQLQLDATYSSFSAQASDLSTITSYTFSGLIGRIGQIGLLRILGPSRPLRNLISHLGSLGAEAETFSLLQGGNFYSHFVNFATFRLTARTGAACCAPTHHFIQSAAMMAGHQVSATLGLEEQSHQSLAQQFFDANVATLQIGMGSFFAKKILGGRLQAFERNLARLPQRHDEQRVENILVMNANDNGTSGNGKPPRPRRGATPLMERLSGPPEPIDPTSAMQGRPQPDKEQICRFHNSLEAYMNLLREGFICIGVNRSAANAIDIFNMYENLYKTIPSSGKPFPWKGFLGLYLRSFSDYILRAEATQVAPDPDLDSLKNKVISIHNHIMLLQEALHIFQRQQSDLNEDEIGLVQLSQQAHEGLRLNRQARATRLTAATHGTSFHVNPEYQQMWTDNFIANRRDPYIAHNVNIIMGNVTLVAAEYVGGSFYRALGRSPVANQVYRVVPFYYDMVTGQILAFGDRSEISNTTLENFRRRNISVGEGRFFVDVEEFGAIVSTQLENLSSTRDSARDKIEGLTGLQVVLPPRAPLIVEGQHERRLFKVMPSHRTRLMPGENSSAFYKILGVANPEGAEFAQWTLLTVKPYADKNESRAFQLWVPRNANERFVEGQLAWMLPKES